MKEEARIVFAPAILRLHQRNGGQVPILSLPTHNAHGLMNQNRYLISLLPLGLLVNVDAHIVAHLHAHLGHFTVHLDPSTSDPVVSFATGGHAQFGHTLV